MIRTTSPATGTIHDTCGQLFADYPLAAEPVNPAGTIHSMALMWGADPEFFILVRRTDLAARPVFYLRPWHTSEDPTKITEDSSWDLPEHLKIAVADGVPLPRNGALLGWAPARIITAVMVSHVEYSEDHPEPTWAAMPAADAPSEAWPPFTGENVGRRLWEELDAGAVVDLAPVVAGTPGTIFWAHPGWEFGGCVVVASDVAMPDGYTLPAARYVCAAALQAAADVPSLDALLDSPGLTDLAPRF